MLKIRDQVVIKQLDVVLRHVQRGVAKEPLQLQGVTSALDEVQPGERVPERVNANGFHATPVIVPCYGAPQSGCRARSC